jgi:hypothetical protein
MRVPGARGLLPFARWTRGGEHPSPFTRTFDYPVMLGRFHHSCGRGCCAVSPLLPSRPKSKSSSSSDASLRASRRVKAVGVRQAAVRAGSTPAHDVSTAICRPTRRRCRGPGHASGVTVPPFREARCRHGIVPRDKARNTRRAARTARDQPRGQPRAGGATAPVRCTLPESLIAVFVPRDDQDLRPGCRRWPSVRRVTCRLVAGLAAGVL